MHQPRPTGQLVPRARKTTKMAADNKIARELLNMVSPYNYISSIALLSQNDIMQQTLFHKTSLSEEYWLDTRHCYRYCRHNPDQLFELFEAFNDCEALELREEMCNRVEDEKDLYDSIGHVPVRLKCNNIDMWIKLMRNQNTFGEKLMLFALVQTFQRHVVVYGKNRCWCTIGTDEPINGDRLLEVCQVHLVYIGENMYGELRRKPFATKRPQFMSATPVYDTGEDDTSNNKTAALNLSQSAIIDINKEDGKRVPSHVHDHDYSKNGHNGRVTDSAEIPEFPEFANISGSSSNSSPSPCDQSTSPTGPSSEIQSPGKQLTKTVSTDSDYDSDDTINYLPCETIQNNTVNGDSIDNALLSCKCPVICNCASTI